MRKITIKEVAALAGVSKTTVSRVLNESNLVTQQTKLKVQRAIVELNYKPSTIAKGLRSNQTKTIGVIVTNILNPFFTNIVRGIEDVAKQSNYNIILCNSDEQSEKEATYLEMLISKKVDGLIIASTGTMNDYTFIKDFPVVFVDRKPS